MPYYDSCGGSIRTLAQCPADNTLYATLVGETTLVDERVLNLAPQSAVDSSTAAHLTAPLLALLTSLLVQ